MSEQTGATATQSDGNATGEQGGSDQQAKTFTQDEVNALIDERLKRATAKWEKDQASAIDKARREALPEADKLKAQQEADQRRIETLLQKARAANGRDAVHQAAKAAGAPDTDLIHRLVRSDIAFDDNDEPTNVSDLIAGVQREYPDLFKVKPGRADQGNTRGGTAKTKDPLREIAFGDA